MSLQVKIPPFCQEESSYIIDILLKQFLGLDYQLALHDKPMIYIQIDNQSIEFPAVFFASAHNHWLKPETLPDLPLAIWDFQNNELNIKLVDNKVPVLFGLPDVIRETDKITFNLDIFGACFFMLSRYEEGVSQVRDQFDRFPASEAIAFKADFIQRPLVNEYLEILWSYMSSFWPQLTRKQRKFRTLISADVDLAYSCELKSIKRLLRKLAIDLIKQKSILLLIKTLKNYWLSKQKGIKNDALYACFSWMMDINEQADNCIAFYFISAHTCNKLDGCYTLDEPVIRELMKEIAQRGHEIGLHASFNTYKDPVQTKQELLLLKSAMSKSKISQNQIGVRQHYLRWQFPMTPQNIDQAGLDYDTSLGFAEQPGFRCGTCYEYPLYDLQQRRSLSIIERPLIVMEASVINKEYLDLGATEQAFKLMMMLKKTCKAFNGDFTLLWHNSSFNSEQEKQMYQSLLHNE